MASTSTSPNNATVKFRGHGGREMPPVSQAQNAAMHAAAEGKSTLGIPKKVGAEFTKAQKPGSVKRLPRLPRRVRKQARRAAKRGLISEKAMKCMGGY